MRKLGLVVGVLALAAGCDSSDASLGGELVPGPATVGAAGGTVVSSDGRAVLAIAPGALSAEIIISIDAVTLPGSSGLEPSLAYDLRPAGLQLAVPARLTLSYRDSLLSAAPAGLRVTRVESGAVGRFGQAREIDLAEHTVSVDVAVLGLHAGTFCRAEGCALAKHPSLDLQATPLRDGNVLVEWGSVGLGDVTYTLERVVCGRAEPLVEIAGGPRAARDGFAWIDSDPLLPAGNQVTYRVRVSDAAGAGGEASTWIVPRARPGHCALTLSTCTVQAPASALVTLTTPPLHSRWVITLHNARGLDSLVSADYTAGAGGGRLDFSAVPGAKGERLIEVIAQDPQGAASCRAPLLVQVK